MSDIRYTVRAGMMIPRCPVVHKTNRGSERCTGYMRVPVTLVELAEIRHGLNKVVKASFNCGHHKDDSVVIED